MILDIDDKGDSYKHYEDDYNGNKGEGINDNDSDTLRNTISNNRMTVIRVIT